MDIFQSIFFQLRIVRETGVHCKKLIELKSFEICGEKKKQGREKNLDAVLFFISFVQRLILKSLENSENIKEKFGDPIL